ncbi:MAG: hypothetical protein HW416_3282 [Chloroflexi bacterium]|nr:hypothetical protein [Chloroflexota bacterium]
MHVSNSLVAAILCCALFVPAFAQEDIIPPSDGSPVESETESLPAPADTPQDVQPTVGPTALPPATAAPAVTPTPAAPAGPGAVLLSDSFDDAAQARLPVGLGSFNRSTGYINGEYEIINGNPERGDVVVSVPVPVTVADASLAVDVRVYGGPSNARSGGVVCRLPTTAADTNYGYRLRVYPDGQMFRIVRIERGGGVFRMLEQSSSAIRTGDAVNRIELHCVGSTISAVINGTQVGSAQDPTYTRGRMALEVGGSGTTGRFDNLVVTQR